jgi:hypothetical protein
MDKKLTLAQKVLAVSESIGCVEKNGLNQHFKFKYQAWDDVLPAVRNACVEIGVQIRPSVVQMTNNNGHTVVTMQFTVCDASTNESEQFQWYGEAKGNDDKGIQKAITSCTKYALLKYFMIPIVDDTDTDAHGPVTPATKPKKSESTNEMSVGDARKLMMNSVATTWKNMGGTAAQFKELGSNLAVANIDVYEFVHSSILDQELETIEAIQEFANEVTTKGKTR